MDDEEWWVRRAVLSGLAVLGVITVVFAIVAVRSGPGPSDDEGDPAETGEAVTAYTPSVTPSDGPLRLEDIVVVGRYGAPVERPAGTLASFDAAIDGGADYLEVQVATTQDEQVVVRGDVELSGTTDVADRPEYADRETTRTVGGQERTGWFVDDFTLEELQELQAVEDEPDLRPESADYDGDRSLVGLDELIEKLREIEAEEGREIGLFIEPVFTSYLRDQGVPLERAVAKSIRKARLINEPGLVTIESGDLGVLERLEGNLGDNVLSAYVVDSGAADELEPDALADLPDSIDAVLVEAGAFAGLCPYDLADDVHEADLAMGVFPISYQNALLPSGFRRGDDPAARGDLQGLVDGLAGIGVDVMLAEAPTEVVEAVAAVPDDLPRADIPECG